MEKGIDRIQDHQSQKKAHVNTDAPQARHRARMNFSFVRLVDGPDTAGQLDDQGSRNQRKNQWNPEGEDDPQYGYDGLVAHGGSESY